MISRRQILPKERDEFAARAVEEARRLTNFFHYGDIASSLPLLLHRHGLGQTLSYLQIRGGGREQSPYTHVYRHLAERLNAVFSLPDDDLLNSITRLNSQQYLRLASEAHAYALALRRAVRAQRQKRESEAAETNASEHSTEEDMP